MKRASCLLVLLLMLHCIAAINCMAEGKSEGVVNGRIVDSLTAVPVASVQLTLLDKTNASVCNTVVSQDDGRFEFREVPYGKYKLKISCPGYLEGVVDDIELSSRESRLNLKNLTLRENVVMLEEVTVTHERLKGEEKIDRTVYPINDDIRSTVSSGLDMLRHIPSVTVDLMENVTLEGRTDIQFYVDGVRRSKEFVAQLDPKMIDRVEVITNPSVKYDADISGVISIILRRDQRSGVSGSVTAALPHPDKIIASPAASLDIGYGNFRFFAGDRMHFEKFEGMESSVGRWDDPAGTVRRFEKTSAGTLSYGYNHLNYGVDWFAGEKTSLNFLGEWKAWKYNPGGDSEETTTYLGNALTEYYETEQDSRIHEDNHYLSLFFLRELEQDGCDLSAELYYHRQSGGAEMDYVDTFFDTEDLATVLNATRRNETTDDLRRTMQMKVDYAFLLKDVRNEMGLRSLAAKTDSRSHSIGGWIGSADVSIETFGYDEWRQQLYYNILGKTEKISWQLGVSGEHGSIDIDGAGNLDDFFLLPQASLQRDFESAGSVKLSFNRKIKRPEVYERHPYEVASDSLHVRTGNPDLDPEVENELELGYSKNFEKNFLNPKLYFQYTGNAIQDVTTVRSDGVSETTRENAGKSMEYGFGINAAFQVTERLRLNGNASIYRQEIRSGSMPGAGWKKQNDGFRFDATTTYSLPKEYSLFLVTQYSSPELSYQRETSRDFLMLLGMGKKFSDRADLNILYAPIITDYTYSKSIIDYPGYHEETTSSVDVRNLFFIEFTYRFNRGGEIKKVERSVEYESSEGSGAL